MRVPFPVLAVLCAGLAAQAIFPRPEPEPPQDMPFPPSVNFLRLMSVGEPVVASKLSMLYVQTVDANPQVAFSSLDYGKIEQWLAVASSLDEKSQYPFFAATHFYAAVHDPVKSRQMLDFVYRKFLRDPNGRWQWLAQAVLLAKYSLHDLPLALEYAQALRKEAGEAPFWARDLSVFVLEDMGRMQSAKILLGGLLASGKINDPNEIVFLRKELERINRK